jgi:hypothetical protein
MARTHSILIAVLYPLIVVIAVLLLAAVQWRSSSGATYDTWRLSYNANRILAKRYLEELPALRKEVFQNIDDVKFTELCLNLYNPDGTWLNTVDSQLREEAKAALAAGKQSADYLGIMRCLLRDYVTLQYDLRYFQSKKEQSESDLKDLRATINANNEQHADLVRGRQEFLALNEMEKGSWYSQLISVTPYNLMILLLVMFMGALGGMVRLLRDYGSPEHEDPPARDYFFVPLIGLVVAVGGYVLAKTGLLLLSSTKDESSLSPFMIGLVGLVSGLMAKEVIDAIARAGEKIFGKPPTNKQPPTPTPAPTGGTSSGQVSS